MIKISRAIADSDYVVGIGDGMTITLKSILRSDFKRVLLKKMIVMTGCVDEYEFRDKNRAINKKLLSEMLADFRECAELAKREAFLETCVTGWNVIDDNKQVEFTIDNVKEVFLSDENKHQVDDLIMISSQEELFWRNYEEEAKEQIKKF